MAAKVLDSIRQLSVQAITRLVPDFQGKLTHKKTTWTVIGLIGQADQATAYLLHYSDGGITQWWCRKTLDSKIRRKILADFREVRYGRKQNVSISNVDLCDQEWAQANAKSHELFQVQLAKWKELAGVVDPEMVELNVPISEKEAAKALGAKWNGRIWQVPKQDNMTPFEKWLIK